MENPELAHTSSKLDKKKKSKLYSDKHGRSSDQEDFLHVDADVKPRRSFWKNLFRKQPKKSEVPEMVTDTKAAVITSRLNAIFEEPKTPEEKEHVAEEIEDIKKTIKKLSPMDLPSPVTPAPLLPTLPPPQPVLTDSPLLDSLSSSTSTSVSSLRTPSAPLAPLEPPDTALGRDGYSFEYSETSEASEEARDNKVLTFDEKVEEKDADSNIVLGELRPENEEIEEIEEIEKIEKSVGLNVEQTENEVEEGVTEIVTGEGVVLIMPSSKIPVAVNDPARKRFVEDSLTTSGSTQTTKTEVPKQWAASGSASATGSTDSLLEEAELWNRKLNELSSTSHTRRVLPTAVDVQSLDEIESGYREYRLDDFFKMIFRRTNDEQLLNYSVAYDPVFANFNVQCRQPNTHLGETESPSDKQKVVRKRKMMSLLHDKTKMAEYLKEIEEQEKEIIKKQQEVPSLENCSTPLNSPNKQESSTLTHTCLATISAGNDEKLRENNNKNVLFVLENTKEKLEKYLERKELKARSLYPENYVEMLKVVEGKSEESMDPAPELPTVEHKIKEFHNIGQEITTIFEELLVNISELKEECIVQGAAHDVQNEPLIMMTPMSSRLVVEPILEDLLQDVFNIAEYDETYDVPGTVNITAHCPAHLILPQFTLERSEALLTALKDEVTDSATSSLMETHEQPYIHLPREQNNPDLIPRNLIPLLKNSETGSQTEPLSLDAPLNDPSVRSTAENLVLSIEKSLERSKKFGPYYERKPGESLDSTKFPQKENELYKNFRSTDVPEMTDSLQHIFFGAENSGEIIQSEFNLVEENSPMPGTSKITDNNNSLDSALVQLPSVPSTDLSAYEINDSHLETLMENRFSGLTGNSSVQEDIPLDLVTFPPDASGSGTSYQPQNEKENLQLERKLPEINLVQNCTEILNKTEIDKSIEDNMKTFQESMNKINKTNAKTVEMLSNSAFSTPEGSLSILSTITENIFESSSHASKTSDERYPQFIPRSDTTSTNPADQQNLNKSP